MRARFVALILVACAGFAWLYQFGEWLVTGGWIRQPISAWLVFAGVGLPSSSSLNGRVLMDHILDFPAPLAVFGVAVVVWLLGEKVQEATA